MTEFFVKLGIDTGDAFLIVFVVYLGFKFIFKNIKILLLANKGIETDEDGEIQGNKSIFEEYVEEKSVITLNNDALPIIGQIEEVSENWISIECENGNTRIIKIKDIKEVEIIKN